MEAKLNQKQEILFFFKYRGRPASNPSVSHSFCFNSCENNKRSLKKQFQALAERWNVTKIPVLFNDQHPAKRLFVHVVKEGETLTSISRRYGVSIQAITAVNSKIVDIDFVLEGQHLYIPLNAEENQMVMTLKKWSSCFGLRSRWQSSFNITGMLENHKIPVVLSSQHLQLAKTTGYYLVLVPLIAFCIGCIMDTFRHKVSSELKCRTVNESRTHNLGSRSVRWKSVLSDIREPDAIDAEPRQDSSNSFNGLAQVPFEDNSHDYTKLEAAYQQFLSECGMSKWGYWRGGFPE